MLGRATHRLAIAMTGLLLVSAAVAGAQGNRATLTGTVRDSLGAGISAAEVRVDGHARRVTTAADGSFRLDGVRAGERTVHVRRLGFRPTSVAVAVAPGAETRVDVALVPLPAQLPAVQITERPAVYAGRLQGFNERRERGVGYFITPERLQQVHSYRFIDIMREVPGVRVGMLRGAATVRMRGASCDPLVFIDGFPAAAGAVDLDMIDLGLVEGIEIYSGLASIPPEFVSVRGKERCGVVAIWTRPFRSRARQARGRAADLEQLIADRQVYTAEQVDSPAALEPGTAAPLYPDSLWQAGVPGRVLVELIVDTAGTVRPGSLRFVSWTHPGFASAVRVSLEEASFRAARREGRRVPQVVQLPFVFDAASTPSGAGAAPPLQAPSDPSV